MMLPSMYYMKEVSLRGEGLSQKNHGSLVKFLVEEGKHNLHF